MYNLLTITLICTLLVIKGEAFRDHFWKMLYKFNEKNKATIDHIQIFPDSVDNQDLELN